MCLGVVPFGVDHSQVARLGNARARSGFAALIYWSPAMRDCHLAPADIADIALAYRWIGEQPYIDPVRSGLFGTCVGGAFALMAAANPVISDCVSFVGAYAPYSSMWTFARDIASATFSNGDGREPWQVDPLTRKVFVHSLTAWLKPDEAVLLHDRGDQVIPIGETRPLYSVLTGHAGVRFTEMLFQHMDTVKGKLSPLRMVRELGKFFLAMYPMFWHAVAS